VFVIGASMNILAALLALFALKPMRAAYVSRTRAPADPGAKLAVAEDTH
jgi:hypothetical protein